MPTPPDDLIELQAAFEAAHAAVTSHITAMDAEHGRDWPDKAADRLEVLRAEELAAVMALHRHPESVRAREEKRWMQLHRDLKAAVGAEGWPAAK